jgi:hypothetical protein
LIVYRKANQDSKVRRIDCFSFSKKRTLLSEVGLDFKTEVFRKDVGCQFGLKDLEGGPVIQVGRLDRSSRDDPDEKLIRRLVRDGIDGKIETVEVFVLIVF